VARIFAATLQEKLGKPFVVVNQDSGGGSVACETVRMAKPDGATILFFHTTMYAIYHTGVYDKSPVDNFTTLAVMPVGGSYALAVGANSPYNSVADLVDAAKKNPDQITIGVQLKGSSHFMAGLLIKDSGAKFKIVEAGSDADKLVTLQGGNIAASFINTPGAMQYAQAGKLRILASIAGFPERDPGAPDIPSLFELGYKSATYGIDFFILGPRGMDPTMAQSINAAFAAVVADPGASEKLKKMRMPVSHLSLDASIARLKENDEKIGATARTLGISAR
jgi:tripartite-type tricarboxylate transporter receptor subunit TctC